MPNGSDPGLISTSDLANKWDVDVRTIHRMVRRGQLTVALRAPGPKGAMFFSRAEVDAVPMVTVVRPAPSAA
jgi:hypothetical protein